MHSETEDIIYDHQTSKRKHFDGVICFGGEDWWYHNRGHYDLQIMRELSRHFPVLYVNSIGMRMPRIAEGKMFFHRIGRKLKSLRRGYRQINDRFAVCSPVILPGRTGLKITGRMLAPQVRRWARKMGIHNPLVWVACPTAAVAIEGVKPVAVVYQRSALNDGDIVHGPALVEEPASVTVLNPGQTLRVDRFGNLTIKAE